ncbi:caspase family protein [Paracoccus sp. 22332]|uniref:caspase family protein n=1 Tax=Paracoccus sp. 22332 TaxID=3453913 RepID=UPI003F875037
MPWRFAIAPILLSIIAAAHPGIAQDSGHVERAPETRIALLIGNESYPGDYELSTPFADVTKLAERLDALGFETKVLKDASFAEMLVEVDRYRRALKGAEGRPIGFFYFAGHGFMDQRLEENFVVPVSNESDLSRMMEESLSIKLILTMLAQDNGNAAQIVMFDACRNAFGGSLESRDFLPVGGFVEVTPAPGMLLMFSTQPRQIAYDRIASITDHSPFAKALLEKIETRGKQVAYLMIDVMQRTSELTAGELRPQLPYFVASSAAPIWLNGEPREIAALTDLPEDVVVLAETPREQMTIAALRERSVALPRGELLEMLQVPEQIARLEAAIGAPEGASELPRLIREYASRQPPSVTEDPPFFYYPSGELLPGTGQGQPDAKNYAEDIVFPVDHDRVAVTTQLYGPAGYFGRSPSSLDAADFRGPIPIWRDNYCEARPQPNAACPAGRGHSGIDLVLWSDRGVVFNAVQDAPRILAIEAGRINRMSDFSLLVLETEGGRRWRYMHLELDPSLRVGQLVTAGQPLGRMSNIMNGLPNTTVHLHLELWADGAFRNPYTTLREAYERRVGTGEPIHDGDKLLSVTLDR